VSATVGEEGSEETADGAEDGDIPRASTCTAHSTALNRTTRPISCSSARKHASRACQVTIESGVGFVSCARAPERLTVLMTSFQFPVIRQTCNFYVHDDIIAQ
jgi:hypothetical protein